MIGSTSRPAPSGVVGGVGRLHLTVLRTKKLKRKEKSWQEEPGEMEEQRRGRSENLDDPAQFLKVIVSG